MKKSQSSDYFNRLEKTLTIDDEGNATFAKSVLADGTIGGNSGLAVVHTIKISAEATVKIIAEKSDEGLGGFNFIGYFYGDTLTQFVENICFGNYLDIGSNYALVNMVILKNKSGVFDDLAFLRNDPSTGELTLNSFAYQDKVQAKLFKHTLTLTADSKSYTLIYPSTNNLKVDSIADLRTIANVETTSDNVILPVCLTDLTGTAVLQITTALCKIGTANVTAVADEVTL